MIATRYRAKVQQKVQTKKMEHSQKLKAVQCWNCPMYDNGDTFSYDHNFLTPPIGKPLCLDLADSFRQKRKILDKSQHSHEDTSFTCAGCNELAHITVELSHYKEDSDEKRWLVETLHKFSFFRLIPEGTISKYYEQLIVDTYKPQEFLFEKGTRGTSLFVIIHGEVEELGVDGKHQITHYTRGSVFGENALLTGNLHNTSVRAVKETKVLSIPKPIFDTLLKEYPILQNYFYRLLSNKLFKMQLQVLKQEQTELHGNLNEWHFPELMQTINMNQKSGLLTINFESYKGSVEFQYGHIVEAHYKEIYGLEAFYAFFTEPEGVFNFEPKMPDVPKLILGDFMSIMMEGLVRVDEAAQNQAP